MGCQWPSLGRASSGPGQGGMVTATTVSGAASPARRDTDHVGVDVVLHGPPATLPLRRDFEHALVVTAGAATVDGWTIEPGRLAYLGRERDDLHLQGAARLLLVGGTPLDEPVLMWWNYVARTREELTAAHRDWTARAERFGRVPSPLPPVDVAGPPWGRE